MKENKMNDLPLLVKDKIFKIKIADLLNETGKEDQMDFEHKFTDQLPNVDDTGIAGTFTFQSLDNSSLLGTLTDVSATFHETCDSCDTQFSRSVIIPLYLARFIFENELAKKESSDSDEVLFFINKKSETINIEDMVVQSLLLNDPFVKRCDACTKRLEDMSDDDEFEDFEPKSNIIFR